MFNWLTALFPKFVGSVSQIHTQLVSQQESKISDAFYFAALSWHSSQSWQITWLSMWLKIIPLLVYLAAAGWLSLPVFFFTDQDGHLLPAFKSFRRKSIGYKIGQRSKYCKITESLIHLSLAEWLHDLEPGQSQSAPESHRKVKTSTHVSFSPSCPVGFYFDRRLNSCRKSGRERGGGGWRAGMTSSKALLSLLSTTHPPINRTPLPTKHP